MENDNVTNVLQIQSTEHEKILKEMWKELHEPGGPMFMLEKGNTNFDMNLALMTCRRMASTLGMKFKLSDEPDKEEALNLAHKVSQQIFKKLEEAFNKKMKSAEKMSGAIDATEFIRKT